MILSDIKRTLAEEDVRLTKSLGQNFLHDGNQLRRVVAAAELTREDQVLEIGPGLGSLTERLLASAGAVLAIEKDRRLVALLRKRWRLEPRMPPAAAETAATPGGPSATFELMHADALDFVRREERDWSGWKLVANLPYSIASPLLVEFARMQAGPRLLVVTLQREVARRLMARPGGEGYGLLTLLVRQAYTPETAFSIPPSCFYPPPRVGSACVTLRRRPERPLDRAGTEAFICLVKCSFSQRRKMLLKRLQQQWPESRLAEAFARQGLSETARAENLGLEQYLELSRELCP